MTLEEKQKIFADMRARYAPQQPPVKAILEAMIQANPEIWEQILSHYRRSKKKQEKPRHNASRAKE